MVSHLITYNTTVILGFMLYRAKAKRNLLSRDHALWHYVILGKFFKRIVPFLFDSLCYILYLKSIYTLTQILIVSTKIGLAPKYYWYKHIVSAIKPLVPRNC